MDLEFILYLIIVCTICRGILFYKRDMRWWYTIIPGLNKYKLGSSIGHKKLGVWNAIMHPLSYIALYINFAYEIYIINNYATEATMKTDGTSEILVEVPKRVAQMAVFMKYVMIVIFLITLIVWCMMMWKFTMKHKRNPWWIMLWAICPVIPYIAFAVSPIVYSNGKLYTMKKVEL